MSDPARFLPYGRQVIEADDIEAVTAVLQSEWLTTGPAVAQFETALAARVNAPHAIACSSGTAALHLGMLAAGIEPGDRVVVPAITFSASANCARYVGAEVIFADVDPDNGLMTSSTLKAALKHADGPVSCVVPVHLAGQTTDLNEVQAIAADHGAIVFEDACHAVGTFCRDGNESYPVGACRQSDMAAFSFHPVKAVAMGEGGAVTCRDDILADRMMTFRNHGITRDAERFVDAEMARDADGTANRWYYELQELGYNYRASDIHCALGRSQLAKLDRFLEQRRALVDQYDRRLAVLAPQVQALARTNNPRVGWHLYVVLIDFAALGLTRTTVVEALLRRGIGTQVHYIPVHRQPYYRARYGDLKLPGADAYYRRCLSLPLFATMEMADVDHVVDTLADVLGLA